MIKRTFRLMHRARVPLLVVGVSLLTVCGFFILESGVQASEFSPRSLTIGTSVPSATTTYRIGFQYPSTTSIGSLRFQFCDNPLANIPCNPVAGLDATGATLVGQTGETGFSVLSANAGTVVLTRAPSVTGLVPATYTLGNIVNPSITGEFFVRILSYTSTDATGPFVDNGSVAGSTASGLTTQLEVPPVLIFCLAQQFTGVDCNTGSGTLVDVGQLTASAARHGSSEMIVATNAGDGYTITVDGITMSAGTFTIPALAAPTASAPGSSQFGINLRDNSDPNVGANQSGPGAPSTVTANYNIPNRYAYASGDTVVTNPIPTDFKKFTVSYVVNVSPSQPAGYYNSTFTYTCTGNF